MAKVFRKSYVIELSDREWQALEEVANAFSDEDSKHRLEVYVSEQFPYKADELLKNIHILQQIVDTPLQPGV